jgi:hypothetical protein
MRLIDKLNGLQRKRRRSADRFLISGCVKVIAFAVLASRAMAPALAGVPIFCWDAASEFNDSNNPDAANPSGVWSYGWKEALTGKFYLALTPYEDPPDRFGWSTGSGYPLINHSIRAVAILMSGPNRVTVPSHALSLHPGPNGEYAVLRFTAPADGTYKASGQFYALDDNATGTTTDVWVLPNNDQTKAFSGRVDYYGGSTWASFTSQVYQLKKGDTLDFQVGYGANKNYEYDSTGLVALIEKIK